MITLTRERLLEVLQYNPETGEFFWRTSGKGRPWHGRAGTYNKNNQLIIRIDYQRYLVSRLAWLYVYGEPIPPEIDHENGDNTDHRITNLRAATHSQNIANCKTRVDNTSGQRGVTWDKQKNKWKVQVGPAGKRVQKHFDDFEEARMFARLKLIEIFGEFARLD
jgi:hypothetical protein